MDRRRLAVRVLQDVAEAAVQYAGLAVADSRRVIARAAAPSAGFDSDQFYAGLRDERVEHARRVAAAADASHDDIRQPAHLFMALPFGFLANHRLKIADHDRERMRADHAAANVLRIADT